MGAGGGAATASSASPPSHFFKATFVDKLGNIVKGLYYRLVSPSKVETDGRLNGPIDFKGVKPGNFKLEIKGILSAGWSKRRSKVGDTVKIKAEFVGVPDGEKARITIWERSPSRPRKVVERKRTKVKGGKISVPWKLEDDTAVDEVGRPKRRHGFRASGFYFRIKVAGLTAVSGLLVLSDTLKIALTDDKGDVVPDEPYLLYLPNGSVRKGTLDSQGRAEEENVPVRGARLCFPGIPSARPLPRE